MEAQKVGTLQDKPHSPLASASAGKSAHLRGSPRDCPPSGDPDGHPNQDSPEAAYMRTGVSSDAISRAIKLRTLGMRKLGKTFKNLLARRGGRTTNAKNSYIWKLLSTLVILAVLIPANLFSPFVPVAQADTTTTIQANDLDSYVVIDSPGSNYGNENYLYVRTYLRRYWDWGCWCYRTQPMDRRTFVRFNISIPSGATIVSARLRLYMDQNPGNRTYEARRVTDATWNEIGITWNNQPGAAAASRLAQAGPTTV